jgi:peptide/nickel transport system substrate-binding protein
VEAARALMEEAGMMDFVHELTSLDSGITRDTADATAAQLRDAGFTVERIIIPSSTFWNDWDSYPFSVTFWSHRALAVQTCSRSPIARTRCGTRRASRTPTSTPSSPKR